VIPDEEARRLIDSVPAYTAGTQAARRDYVRRVAARAADILTEAADCDDPDQLGRLISGADQALGAAVIEVCRAHLG
jgi:hypothetical protein